MVYRLILIFIIFSFAWTQSYFNRSLGSTIPISSSRVMAMGSVNLIDYSSSSSLFSPSLLASNSIGFTADLFLVNESIVERRGVNVKDYFGDYLTNADYVVNRNNYNNLYGGLIYGLGRNYFSISKNIISSFSYDYVEEVHGRYSLGDDEIGNKDPISGFHNLKIDGEMESVSIGYARSGKVFDFGLGYHFIPSSSVTERLWIDTLSTNNTNLSSVVAHSSTYDMESDTKYSIGFNFHINKTTNLLLSFLSRSLLSSDNSYQFFINEEGIISHTYIDDQASVNYIDTKLSFRSPQITSLGIQHIPKGLSETMVAVELDMFNQEFSYRFGNNYLNQKKNRYRFSLGVEYIQDKTSFRTGLSYMTRYFESVDPVSTFSLGIGKKIDALEFDFAIQYQLSTHTFPDMFPIDNNLDSELENINESSLFIIFGIRY